MKVRIKGNFVRFRLVQSEVKTISELGSCEEKTVFGISANQTFTYRLVSKSGITQLEATLENNVLTMYMPIEDAKKWHDDERVGYENDVDNGTATPLHLLLEKDFVCLDETVEDQSDNYPHPFENLHK
jgi:hypothetical protein